ncbi:MAG: hypothetical protein K0U72_11900 [Gammaproteobacteria bacterium]|nr:hypothetical protein [Gammaproteobacteria bacterium]
MTTSIKTTRSGGDSGFRALIALSTVMFVAACGGGGGGETQPPSPPPPPAAKTFQTSLDEVIAIDRSDGSTVQVSGSGFSGATATMP